MSAALPDPEKLPVKKDDLTTIAINATSGSDSDSDSPPVPKPTKRTYTFRITLPTLAAIPTPAWLTTLAQKLPTPFPGREKIASLKRKTFFRLTAAAAIVLLILIIAIPAGVAAKKNKDKKVYIPLPSSSEAHFGSATYYAPGLGACGQFAAADAPVIALGHATFDLARSQYPADENGANGGACGRKIRLYRVLREGEGPGSWIYEEAVKGGLAGRNVSVEGVVGDRCPGCGPTDLDLGPALFNEIATEGMGRVGVRWAFV